MLLDDHTVPAPPINLFDILRNIPDPFVGLTNDDEAYMVSIALQPLNILLQLVSAVVSKLDKSRTFNDEQLLKHSLISLHTLVSKFAMFIVSKAEHPEKAPYKVFTLYNIGRLTSFKEESFINITLILTLWSEENADRSTVSNKGQLANIYCASAPEALRILKFGISTVFNCEHSINIIGQLCTLFSPQVDKSTDSNDVHCLNIEPVSSKMLVSTSDKSTLVRLVRPKNQLLVDSGLILEPVFTDNIDEDCEFQGRSDVPLKT